jgi:hypothetical protein
MDAQSGKPGQNWLKWAAICGVAILAILGTARLFSTTDGIETGKNYRLAASFGVDITQGKDKIPGRQFDFADRNLPQTSIVVPETDERGVKIAVFDTNLPPSTVKKVMVNVPERQIEGVKYPAYSYPQWRYNMGTVEIQSVRPTVVPKK